MNKAAIFTAITERNALRKQAQLPLLDVRAELDHACAVARYAEWHAFCEAKRADILRIQAETVVELRATRGEQFPSNSFSTMWLNRVVEDRFEAYAAIHYGVQRPRYAARHPVIYGGAKDE